MKKFAIAAILGVTVISIQLLSATHTYAQTANEPAVQLKSFVGKYQFTDNKMVFLQILLKDDQLVLKQLWDNQEFPFKQTSALEFYNDEHEFPLKFTKNDKGEITQVLAFNRDVWNRVPDNYTQELQKVIKLGADQLKAFAGKYEKKDGDGDADDKAEIAVVDDHLVIRHEQNNASLWPVSETDFVNDNQTFVVKFTKAANGSITQAVVNNRDIWLKMK